MGVTKETLEDRVERMAMHLKACFDDQQAFIRTALQSLEKRILARMDARLDMVDARLDKVDERLDKLDERFDGADGRFDGIDGRLARLEANTAAIRRDMKKLLKSRRPR